MSNTVPERECAWRVGTAPGIFPFLGHGIALYRRPLAFLNSLPAHGDLVEIRLGPQRAWMVCHPELVHRMLGDSRTFDKGGPLFDRLRLLMGNGLVTSRHEEHRCQRRLLQPAFIPSRLPDQTELMAEEAEAVCRDWRAGQEVDVSAAMMALSTRIISRVLFSDSLDAATAAEVRHCLAAIVRGLFVRTAVPIDALFRVPSPANRRYRRAVDRVHAIIDAAIAERRRGAPRDDLLGTLLEATRATGPDTAITEREVHDHLVSLLLTGSESTALCLASAFSLLAQHPQAERRLHADIDAVLAGRQRPGPDDLPHLVHARCVVTETLRHSPPGWLFTRITTKETELAGLRLPQGATVVYSPYLLHHDPAWFPDPDRFLPERWSPGRPGTAAHGAMLPFATGSRKCIADAFAMTETTVALATVAARWRLTHLPGRVAPPRPGATLGPRSLVMICEPRARVPIGTSPHPGSCIRGETAAHPVQDSRRAGDSGVDHA
ncbi:cytochrome P450 [Streptomyces sp. B21-108]|uniref:cytochrome P450 n=1 Tax=Streptomyces sp. B21-108 TaxID=3039419 RepID=UPI002FEF7BEB